MKKCAYYIADRFIFPDSILIIMEKVMGEARKKKALKTPDIDEPGAILLDKDEELKVEAGRKRIKQEKKKIK